MGLVSPIVCKTKAELAEKVAALTGVSLNWSELRYMMQELKGTEFDLESKLSVAEELPIAVRLEKVEKTLAELETVVKLLENYASSVPSKAICTSLESSSW